LRHASRRGALVIACGVAAFAFIGAAELAQRLHSKSDLQLMATTPVAIALDESDAALRAPAVTAPLIAADSSTDTVLDSAERDLRDGVNSILATIPAPSESAPSVTDQSGAYFDATTRLWYEERRFRICRVTAYCDRGTTAAGVPSGLGQCAAPGDVPLGSKVYIPALDRTFIVTDRTHRRFRNSTVDLFIPSRAECREFGRKFLECEFHIVTEEPRYGSLRITRRP
jgi:3D (Asp-Asp-Asp) domain-containing protein